MHSFLGQIELLMHIIILIYCLLNLYEENWLSTFCHFYNSISYLTILVLLTQLSFLKQKSNIFLLNFYNLSDSPVKIYILIVFDITKQSIKCNIPNLYNFKQILDWLKQEQEVNFLLLFRINISFKKQTFIIGNLYVHP